MPRARHGTEDWLPAFAHALARWFDEHQRDLTWRRTRDPYGIWVSEVMLQQTRVETVERYYSRFMQRFPNIGALAAADEEQVLQAWSGLGYYRRARMLHAGARVVAERFGATMPASSAGLRQIPGIGPYTAGAIAAIAFDRREPLVDGNVARVLSRVGAVRDPARQAATASAHWQTVARMLEHGQPRVLAQALMELGATVCLPRNPVCDRCPVAQWCAAKAQGLVAQIPAPKTRAPSPVERWWAVVIGRRGRHLLVRRPAQGLLAGLWSVPMVSIGQGRAPGDVGDADLHEAVQGDVRIERRVTAPVVHVFTHRRWELHVLVCSARGRVKAAAGAQAHGWFGGDEAPDGGMPTVTRRLLAAAGR